MSTLLNIYAAWITLFTVGFMFLPINLCLEWYRKKTSAGFSSVVLVFAGVCVTMWLRYGFLIQDNAQIFTNIMVGSLLAVYLSVFCFYQPEKKNVLFQMALSAFTLLFAFSYVETLSEKDKGPTMGAIAGAFQSFSNIGLVYEIYRVFRLKTTEYLLFSFTFGGFVLCLQWWIYGLATNDSSVMQPNLVGMAINTVIFVLYFFYPPLTWTVPLIGKGPQKKEQ